MKFHVLLGELSVRIAQVALLRNRKQTHGVRGCDRLVALCADRVDRGIVILPSGERDKACHFFMLRGARSFWPEEFLFGLQADLSRTYSRDRFRVWS